MTDRRRTVAPATVGAAVVLVGANVALAHGTEHTRLIVWPATAAALAAVIVETPLGLADLGLDPAAAGRGARAGLAASAVVAAACAATLAHPSGRALLRDERHRHGPGRAALTAGVVVPLGTVLPEELAFRGLLWGMLDRDLGPGRATAVTAVLFGMWHALTARGLTEGAPGVRSVAGPDSGRVRTAAATVAVTTAAGVVFGRLRHRTGSLLAPALLHWATNGFGALAAAAAWRDPAVRPEA